MMILFNLLQTTACLINFALFDYFMKMTVKYAVCFKSKSQQFKNHKNSGKKTHMQPQPSIDKQYQKTNAYTQKPSVEQILTIGLFISHFTMHCVFVIRPIVAIDHPILYVSWVLFYLLLILMSVDYCVITCGDPVDLALIDEVELTHYRFLSQQFRKNLRPGQQGTLQNPYRTRYCQQCQHSVKFTSYHCWRCGRCVEGMDHHCKYLNNCIGARNYAPFFRMLITTTVYLLLSVMHTIWVFVVSFSSQRVNELCFSRWAVLVTLIFAVILILAVDSLLCFHFYISCGRKMTTIQYLFRDTPSNADSAQTKEIDEQSKEDKKIKKVKLQNQMGNSAQNLMHDAGDDKQSNQRMNQRLKTPLRHTTQVDRSDIIQSQFVE